MKNALTLAKNLLLNPAAIDESSINKLMKYFAARNIDDADLYFQTSKNESWYLEDSQVKSGSFSIDRGVGIRAVSEEKTGYAYCDEIQLPALERAASAASSIAYSGKSQVNVIPVEVSPIVQYEGINPIEGMSKKEKILLLEAIDKEARSIDPRVCQVTASLRGTYEVVLIAGLDGQLNADIRPLVSISVNVIVEEKGRRESAQAGGGGRVAYSYFTEKERALEYAREAVRQALVNLKSVAAPAGLMPVVLGSGWPGVMLHEAVGHGLEGDFNRKGTSAFSDKLGAQVANRGITVVDDATMPNRRGSLTVDDEGVPGQKTVLIEDGVLVNYMQDKLNAKLMNMKSTGNCRRESYSHVPMPRMTNTYMLAGGYEPDEIIGSVSKGLYAVNFGGGQVDITSGQFVFSASEAYLIENGKITKPVKGATLIGNGPDVMKKISMVGNNLELDAGTGVCGKDGQSVPVGVGQPTLKIDELTVGGTR